MKYRKIKTDTLFGMRTVMLMRCAFSYGNAEIGTSFVRGRNMKRQLYNNWKGEYRSSGLDDPGWNGVEI